jgi:membrane protein insertase, YidC/Oxa1 family, C-terminal domain
MNKNTIIGFVLIGVILVGFSLYNSKVYKEQAREKFIADSIARVEAQRAARADSIYRAQHPDTLNLLNGDSTAIAQRLGLPIYKDTLLELASKEEPEFYTLQNNKVEIKFTTKGGQAYQVLIKDYYTYDSLGLYFMKPDASKFGISFFAGQQLNSTDFNYKKIDQTDTSLVMRLYFAEDSYVEHTYILPADSYILKYNLRMKGMDKFIPKNVSYLDVDWSMNIPRLEKGYDNEKNYSTIDYKYPNDNSVENLGLRKTSSEQELKTKVEWFAFQQQFFSGILLADNNFLSGNLSYKFYDEGNKDGYLMNCDAKMQVEYSSSSSDVVIPFQFYYGPNLYKVLKSNGHNFEKIVPLGGWLIGWINRVVIINIFDFLNRFISNYGIIILLLTIFIKLVISPLTIKSYMSSAKMRVLKPEIDKINDKYPKKEDAMKKQQEIMGLYKKTGVSMFGGCLPMLLQFPILFAMFRFFPVSFELRQEPFLWADDLSAYDSILNLPFKIPLYGDHVSLFALLMAISMYLYSKINMDQMPSTGQQMAGMKFMQLYFMPLFLLVLCNNFSSGLSYYYMLSNLFIIVQTWVIKKFFVDEKKLYAQLKAKAANNTSVKKSKFQQRLDELYKQQQQQRAQQQKK